MAEFSPEKATSHLVAECNQQGRGWHSIYYQKLKTDEKTYWEGIVVHIRPGHESKWRNRERHFGYLVDVRPWPEAELE